MEATNFVGHQLFIFTLLSHYPNGKDVVWRMKRKYHVELRSMTLLAI